MWPRHIARIEFGEGSAENVACAFDSYLAVSMEVPWALARDRLGKPPRRVHLVESVEFSAVVALANAAHAVEAV